jgi:hypothetical protein
VTHLKAHYSAAQPRLRLLAPALLRGHHEVESGHMDPKGVNGLKKRSSTRRLVQTDLRAGLHPSCRRVQHRKYKSMAELIDPRSLNA